ncbi:GMC oxidoreductase [Pelagicoccus sp. SDUM812003]|uniref:GMC oxidoreductase n=1 Tax=Pelagicoccus sp. SDUM812003 TaxID=3041267 RepID=UPI00280E8118|nr:GMC oxidoreductase [Pelagicoccus sp. SDUM812003]MDQ8203852.1 GMC oxidoreductase [Pelagicoccus sp. SDUM812003]
MAFSNNYVNMVAERTQSHSRLIRDYDGGNPDFDFIVIGSGIGGGILADDLADRVGSSKRILVIESGSFIYPTHVYNISRIPNFSVANHFGADCFKPYPNTDYFIGGAPQMGFGGRSIFWSGLIPQAQGWELDYFPEPVRNDFSSAYFSLAGQRMNESHSLGARAEELVARFRASSLNDDFVIEQTPRALHQPYLYPDGTPKDKFFDEPTGVFNTAELLINQVGLTPGADQNGGGLFLKLNAFVEGVHDVPFGWHEVRTTDTVNGQPRRFYAPRVIVAAGSIESPKLINRSSVYHHLSDTVRRKVGFGLTDHPVSGESQAFVSGLGGGPAIPLSRNDHAKIVFYSRGLLDAAGNIDLPFNVEMNINHEYWHLRNNDPSSLPAVDNLAKSRIDIKFSFANCLDDENGILSRFDDGYTPEIRFRRFSDLNHLLQSRFPAVAGWNKSPQDFFNLLNATRDRIFSLFNGVDRITGDYGGGTGQQWPFGWGTVHHACGTLRMPWKPSRNAPDFNYDSVVDENLQVRNAPGLYVCDMSVMPISTAANPVRSLAALALRLSQHLA